MTVRLSVVVASLGMALMPVSVSAQTPVLTEQDAHTTALFQAVSVSAINPRIAWISGHAGTWARTINGGATLALSGAGSIAGSSGVADAGTFDISATGAGASIVTLSGAGGVTLGAQTLDFKLTKKAVSGP